MSSDSENLFREERSHKPAKVLRSTLRYPPTAKSEDFPIMAQTTQNQDFQPLPTYTQSTTSNDRWVNVTTTRTDPDGSVAQSLQIISKR
jgi:hypothetical protein